MHDLRMEGFLHKLNTLMEIAPLVIDVCVEEIVGIFFASC